MASAIALLAIFPVVFVGYLGYLVPSIAVSADETGAGPLIRWLVAVAVIASAMVVTCGAR
jgi:hypothetical protein